MSIPIPLQYGGGVSFYQGRRYMRGSGIWSRALSAAVIPALKFLGMRAANTASNVLADVASGEDPMQAVTNRVKEEGKSLVNKATSRVAKFALTGKGKKRMKSMKGGRRRKRVQKGGRSKSKRKSNKRNKIPDFLK